MASEPSLLTLSFINYYSTMASPSTAIDVDINDNDSDLTTLNTGDTPTDPWSNDTPQIQAFHRALGNKIQYQQILDAIPGEHKVKVKTIRFIKYSPYRTPREIKDAWYWGPEQASELFRVTEGMHPVHLHSVLNWPREG